MKLLESFAYLFVLEPGEALGGKDEPVVPAPALHDAEVVDGHIALPDDLVAQLPASLFGILARGLSTETRRVLR